MIAKIVLHILIALNFISVIFYFVSVGKKYFKLRAIARYSFYALSLGLVFLVGYFLSHILAHNFQFTYIYNHSSKELTDLLLISTLWAGQEGSLLFWAFIFGLIGLTLIPYCQKNGYESIALGFYSLIILFMLLMMLVQSPFDYIWDTFAQDNLKPGFLPLNGKGLNPILQNYWMAIHPPILFIGYAAASVPYVFAITGLIKKDYSGWTEIVYPWTLFAACTLGAGLILGGFWAYETLGWGGFWGWDPVENSSLLPWIVLIALIHTLIVQKKTGGLIKTNLLLSILSFLLVIYATFLTRSGLFGKISNHSFTEPENIVYLLLLIFLLSFLLLGLIVFLIRLKAIPKPISNFDVSSKEFSLSLGAIVLLVSTFTVMLGTNYPLLSNILSDTQTSVDSSFYNKWNLPLLIFMLLFMSASTYLNWKSSNWMAFFRKSLVSTILALTLTTVLYLIYNLEYHHLILTFFLSSVLLVNLLKLIAKGIKSPLKSGVYLAHLGFALFFIGTLLSNSYSTDKTISLKLGNDVKSIGKIIKLNSKEQIEKNLQDRQKYQFNISVSDGENETMVKPIMYWSSFNNFQSPFKEPGISSGFMEDIYMSPLTVNEHSSSSTFSLSKGETGKLIDDSTISIKYINIDTVQMTVRQDITHDVFALSVKLKKDSKELNDTLFAISDNVHGSVSPVWYEVPQSDIFLGLTNIYQKDSSEYPEITIGVSKETLLVDISVKPFISLVWIGSILMVIGLILPIFRKK